jgi:hypothetical protein
LERDAEGFLTAHIPFISADALMYVSAGVMDSMVKSRKAIGGKFLQSEPTDINHEGLMPVWPS